MASKNTRSETLPKKALRREPSRLIGQAGLASGSNRPSINNKPINNKPINNNKPIHFMEYE